MLARHARDRLSTRLLRDLADQWRQLAHDTDRLTFLVDALHVAR